MALADDIRKTKSELRRTQGLLDKANRRNAELEGHVNKLAFSTKELINEIEYYRRLNAELLYVLDLLDFEVEIDGVIIHVDANP